MKILVTGFKPFLGHSINPSEQLSCDLAKKFTEVTSLILPVEFGTAAEVLASHLQSHMYDYILLVGQASGRARVSLERIGLNWIESNNQDEAGYQPVTGPIVSGAPLALMTSFPISELCEALQKQNLPVHISFSAGTYVCNDIYFRALHRFPQQKLVFIHVPLLPDQHVQSGAQIPSAARPLSAAQLQAAIFHMDYGTQFQVLEETIKYLITKD